jgi:hypothetical protein
LGARESVAFANFDEVLKNRNTRADMGIQTGDIGLLCEVFGGQLTKGEQAGRNLLERGLVRVEVIGITGEQEAALSGLCIGDL